MNNPYNECPVLETKHFTLRLVVEGDASDLLACYSDPKAQELFNIDNFPIDCRFNTLEEMSKYIKFWLMEYSEEAYVRFSIIDKTTQKAVGTIEMFGMVGKYKVETGLLRIDIVSDYENSVCLKELFDVCVVNFYDLFGVSCIATKAIPQADKRIQALSKAGFTAGDYNSREHYFLRRKKTYLWEHMECKIYPFGTLKEYIYADAVALHQGKWIFCKHRDKNTWEHPAGHIESGETPLEAAKRELYEEAGAVDFDIEPLCDYFFSGILNGKNIAGNGQVFFANVRSLSELPHYSEMEKIQLFDSVPDDLTYPVVRDFFPLAIAKQQENNY
jgi:8-oxo-dGTP diphosphatase